MNQRYAPYIILIIMFLIMIGIPVWDKLMPMPGGREVIQQHFGDQFAWCVAFTYSFNSNETNCERIYVLFPKVFSDASIVSISSTNEDSPLASQRKYGALFFVFIYGGIYISYWKLMRQRGSKPNSRKENTEDVQMK
jgi:hypothetical protein